MLQQLRCFTLHSWIVPKLRMSVSLLQWHASASHEFMLRLLADIEHLLDIPAAVKEHQEQKVSLAAAGGFGGVPVWPTVIAVS